MRTSRRGPTRRAGIRGAVSIAAVFIVSAGACDITGPDEVDELGDARALWVSLGITDYAYVLQRGCFCTLESIGPVTITVRGGAIESRVYVASGQPVVQGGELWPTIDGLFDLVERAVDDEAHSVVATYDAERGFPLTVDIDYIEFAIDDELTLTVSSFTSLPIP